jgi:glutaredoxin-like YruB-family protein
MRHVRASAQGQPREDEMGKKVVVYSTPACPYCIRAKQFLKEHNVAFEDNDVSSDRAKAQEMMRKSGQMGVPVLDIEGEVIVGFEKERIKSALGI